VPFWPVRRDKQGPLRLAGVATPTLVGAAGKYNSAIFASSDSIPRVGSRDESRGASDFRRGFTLTFCLVMLPDFSKRSCCIASLSSLGNSRRKRNREYVPSLRRLTVDASAHGGTLFPATTLASGCRQTSTADADNEVIQFFVRESWCRVVVAFPQSSLQSSAALALSAFHVGGPSDFIVVHFGKPFLRTAFGCHVLLMTSSLCFTPLFSLTVPYGLLWHFRAILSAPRNPIRNR
jgi:hypothetical protein